MIVSSSVFLLSLTFCCLHSIHCTCYVLCDDHQSTYFLYLPLDTYLLFSWWHPVHWPLSLLTCLPHLCIWILTLTFLFFTGPELLLQSCEPRTSGGLPLVSASACAVQCIYHLCCWAFCFIVVSWSVLTVIWASGLLHRCPAPYQPWLDIFSFIVLPWSVLSLSWASGLSFCSQTIFFLPHLWLEPATSSTEAKHTINCASQTAVMTWGIIFVYMLSFTDVSPSKKENDDHLLFDLETTASEV